MCSPVPIKIMGLFVAATLKWRETRMWNQPIPVLIPVKDLFCRSIKLLTKAPSTLLRFRLKTHTFFIRVYRSSTPKRSKTEMFIYENGGFRKRFPEWRLLKTQVYRFSVDGKNGAFQKRLRHNSLCKTNSVAGAIGACVSNEQSLVTKTHLWIIVFQLLVWTVENDVKTLVWTQGFLSIFG